MPVSDALGWASPFQMELDGVNTTRTNFCVGENLKITCTVASNKHLWIVPDYIRGAVVLPSYVPGTKIQFRLKREDVLPNLDVISSLSFAVFSDLDGVTITCSNGSRDPETQTLRVTVLGKVMVASYVCVCDLIVIDHQIIKTY